MDGRTPYVAIVGGLWQLESTSANSARDTGRILGTELAKAGFGLTVYFSDNESLEPHVVSGYVSGLDTSAGKIRVRYAESQRGKITFAEEAARPDVFEHRLFPGEEWEMPFYRSLTEEDGVDAILLVGGATSTFIAGQIAIARRLPVLAVDAFGGAAAKIWNQLAQASPQNGYYSWGTQQPAAFVKRLKSECDQRAARRQEASKQAEIFARITSQNRSTAFAFGSFVALLVTLFFGMVYTPFPSAHTFIAFTGLITAGATGALVRLILAGSGTGDARTSLLLGGIAGFVVGLAYLIPQWVGAPGVLSPTSEAVSATDKIQFASAVLVAISAGVGFDTVFSRLQQQAKNAAVSPP